MTVGTLADSAGLGQWRRARQSILASRNPKSPLRTDASVP